MLQEWKIKQSLDIHAGDVTGCDFFEDTLATCSNDKTVRLWRSDAIGRFAEEEFSPLLGHRYGVNAVRFSPLGSILASCSIDGTAILWNTQRGEQVTQLQHQSAAALRACCFSLSGALLATGGDDETLVLWDLSTRSIIRSLEGHVAMVAACCFSPDSSFLVSGGTGGDLKLWDARYGHGKCLFTRAEAHDLGVMGCDFSPQYEASSAQGTLHSTYILASCGNDDLVKVWKVQVGTHCVITHCFSLEGHSGNVMCCRFSPDGTTIASSAGDHRLIIWDAITGQLLQKLESQQGNYIPCCAFSSDGNILATGSNDRTVLIWSLGEPGTTEDETPSSAESSRPSSGTRHQAPTAHGLAAVGKWSVGDVCDWLDKVGLSQYKPAFQEQCIDGQELLHLTHDSLNTALKIEALGQRNRLLREIHTLKNPLWQHYSLPDDDGTLPEEFYCPITQELMKDPVVAADGYTYERTAIMQWLESGKDTSPMTNETLEHTVVIPNRTFYLLIRKYLA
ncbi:WD repeat, SAM and U-box domain-containing protein 1-like [Ornithodoros turicata]